MDHKASSNADILPTFHHNHYNFQHFTNFLTSESESVKGLNHWC